jgi:ATP-dependent DNA helicase DinG
MENVAAEHLGIRVSSGGVRHLLNMLLSTTGKGLLAAADSPDEARQCVESCRSAARRFFTDVALWAAEKAPKNLRVHRPGIVAETLSDHLARLSQILGKQAGEPEIAKDLGSELSSRANQCSAAAEGIRTWLAQGLPGQVYWIEVAGEDQERVTIKSAPIRVGNLLSELLFDTVRSVVMTSATLTVGENRSFAFVRDRLGLVDAEEESLGSPFDFRRQVKIHLPRRMPDPKSGEPYEQAVAEQVRRAVFRSDGRAFVLFTSYRMLERVYQSVRDDIESRGYRLLRQGGGVPRSRLIAAFREDVQSILFGTDSFWQGVDVPGEALSHVIITKLPFEVPDRPLIEARLEELEGRGINAFMEYSLPRAVLRLKQGFGRLIRNRDDVGEVTILDPRVRTKRYGRIFLDSLPDCEIVVD